jgi:hypothetical protein
MYADWGKEARAEIAERVALLPEGVSLEERRKALRKDASLFHGGTSWGKKVWSRECRKYLEQHGLPPRTVADASPQSKLYARAQSGDITFPFKEEGKPQ